MTQDEGRERDGEGQHLHAGVAPEGGGRDDVVLDGVGRARADGDGAQHLEDGAEDHGLAVGDGPRRHAGRPRVCHIVCGFKSAFNLAIFFLLSLSLPPFSSSMPTRGLGKTRDLQTFQNTEKGRVFPLLLRPRRGGTPPPQKKKFGRNKRGKKEKLTRAVVVGIQQGEEGANGKDVRELVEHLDGFSREEQLMPAGVGRCPGWLVGWLDSSDLRGGNASSAYMCCVMRVMPEGGGDAALRIGDLPA